MDVGYIGCGEQEATEGHTTKECVLARLETVYVADSSLAAERLPHERNHVLS